MTSSKVHTYEYRLRYSRRKNPIFKTYRGKRKDQVASPADIVALPGLGNFGFYYHSIELEALAFLVN